MSTRESPEPILVIDPDRRRELDRRARRYYDTSLEGMYGCWAYWNRKAEEIRALPFRQRRRVRVPLQEAERTADGWLARIRSLASRPNPAEDGEAVVQVP